MVSVGFTLYDSGLSVGLEVLVDVVFVTGVSKRYGML